MMKRLTGAGRGASLRGARRALLWWRPSVLLLPLCMCLCLWLLLWPAAHAQQGAQRPIKVGAVSALSGPHAFPESSQAAKAYIDAVNAAGGIGGRRIEYISLDEGGSPASAVAAATRLINDAEVVALERVGEQFAVESPGLRREYLDGIEAQFSRAGAGLFDVVPKDEWSAGGFVDE